MKYKITTALIIFIGLTGCNDVLDETPDNRTAIDSKEKIAELLTDAYPIATYAPFLEPMSDNAGDKGPSAKTSPQAERLNEAMYFWKDLIEIDEDTPTYYWNQAYAAIAQANQALASIEELGGGSDFDPQKGEALLCRAYAHFMLVNMFSKSYDPSTASSDMGIPYVKVPEDVFIKNYTRGTVADVYENIEADITAGLPLIKDDTYTIPAYHFTRRAANAFAARFYTVTAQWQKVIDHSTIALGAGTADVLRGWEANYRPKTYSEQTRRFSSATQEPANLLVVSAYSLYNRFHYGARYQLNSDIRDQLFLNPSPIGRSWSYTVFGSSDLFYNVPKFFEYFKVTNQSAGTGLPYVTIVLLSTEEALLNRAEAYAMLGSYEAALKDIDLILSVNVRQYNETTDALDLTTVTSNFAPEASVLTPFYELSETSSTAAVVNLILQIKRTVFYNEGLRWFDLKRFNTPVEHLDVLRNKETLTKDDPRRELQIPEAASAFGITKNPRPTE